MFKTESGNEQTIYNGIKQAILEHKLRPNTQLVEDALAETFKVSRTPVRQALRKLAYENLVKIIPNKGAFVNCPTIEEAKDIIEVRETLEAGAVRLLCGKITEQQINELTAIVEEERKASLANDKFGSLKLSLGFHLKIGELTGNSYYYRYLEELTSLVFVIVTFYGAEETFSGWQAHMELIDIIKEKDPDKAEKFMIDHLEKVASGINFNDSFTISIEELFK